MYIMTSNDNHGQKVDASLIEKLLHGLQMPQPNIDLTTNYVDPIVNPHDKLLKRV